MVSLQPDGGTKTNTKIPITPTLSIVIPTLNEEGNVIELSRRIYASLSGNARFELIFIDDHSSDSTLDVLEKLASKSHGLISVHTKLGRPGKAFSLLEGFKHAKYKYICMIDADLQYRPESIPEMIAKLEAGSDIVVANRIDQKTGMLRKLASRTFQNIFARRLHGLDMDVQSGLKIFRAEVIERLTLTPSPWAFDVEFLVKSRHAGYAIDSIETPFDNRISGQSKIKLLSSSPQIALASIKSRLAEPQVIHSNPGAKSHADTGFHYKGKHYVTHSDLHHDESALRQLSRYQIVIFTGLAVILLELLLLNAHTTLTIFIAALTIVYFADLLYNLFLISRSFDGRIEIDVTPQQLARSKNREWPSYTVFCPLYKEWEVLPQFVTAMDRLDYPKDKLQVMLLLEADDQETIDHARAMGLPSFFEIVVVPHSMPKTKPKACNYGLKIATGEYSVIYDAEDVPEPTQLKKAVMAFERSSEDIACIQAKLNFYNPRQNILTRAFTAEYSLWFDLVLTGLQAANAPIPLGGTSNHFKTSILKDLKGWDAFNVTEDCDLGLRIAKNGYRTAIVDSVTLEEANSAPVNWFFQRTRWIKGYIQTYWIHMRNLKDFKLTLKEPHAITFQLIVGGKIASMFINPLMWVLTISYFVFRASIGPTIESYYPSPILYMAVTCIIFGNFLYMYYYMLGCAKREQYDLIKYAYLVPIYWLAMSAAAWVGFVKLFYQPHQWFKTQHGLHLTNDKTMDQVHDAIGGNMVDNALVQRAIPLLEVPISK
jgi:cellulose synthase/poly-beta-1,6-N-acetylglucosamine synthase-like glycosyltransferase